MLTLVTGLAGLGSVVAAHHAPARPRTVAARPLPAAPGARFGAGAVARAGLRGDADAPVLVLTDPTVPFDDAVCRAILATEGLPSCAATDTLPPGAQLKPYRVVIAADGHPLPTSAVQSLTGWVRAGGHLVALRPADNLGPLLGLGPRRALLDDAYVAIGSRTLRYHGEADEHSRAGAQTVARLFSSLTEPAGFPAVTTHTVGRGTAEAWAFDPARSVLRSRNGDPDLIGRRTVSADENLRLADRFGDGYLDEARAGVPQADELMHLLTSQILRAAPLPRLWYLPSYEPATHAGGLLKAAVVLTGDDHDEDHGSRSRTLARFAGEHAASPAGCSPADWTCVTSTSYAFPGAFSDASAKAYADQGFEVAPHISENSGCVTGRNAAGLDAIVRGDLSRWSASFPTLAAAYPPMTERWHCYGDWTTDGALPRAEEQAGLTADLSTACWPAEVFDTPQCLLTGSALPMPYADSAGRLSGVTAFTTLVTDENPVSSSRSAVAGLMEQALDGTYGYLTTLAHLDGLPESERLASEVTELARAYDLPVISARQAATFWAGRAATRLEHVRPTAGRLTFDLTDPVNHLELMIPTLDGARQLASITRGGSDLEFTTQTLDGVTYALLPSAAAGHYAADYR